MSPHLTGLILRWRTIACYLRSTLPSVMVRSRGTVAFLKTHQHSAWVPIRLVLVAGLYFGAGGADPQSNFYLRVGPEMGRISVEHTKKVTIQGGSSASTSPSSGLSIFGNVAAGMRLSHRGTGSWGERWKQSFPAGASSRARSPRRRTGTPTASAPAGGTTTTWRGRAATSSSGEESQPTSLRSMSWAGSAVNGRSLRPEERIPRREWPAKTASAWAGGRGESVRERLCI